MLYKYHHFALYSLNNNCFFVIGHCRCALVVENYILKRKAIEITQRHISKASSIHVQFIFIQTN